MNYSKLRNDFTTMIMESDNLTSNETLVALVLKEHMNNETGKCYPSINTLINKTKLSKSSVIRSIKGLEDKLFIKVWKERWNGQQHNCYSFILNDNTPSVRETPAWYQSETKVVSERHPNLLLPSTKPSINVVKEEDEVLATGESF